jgi:hypothetical protein
LRRRRSKEKEEGMNGGMRKVKRGENEWGEWGKEKEREWIGGMRKGKGEGVEAS